MTDTKPPSAEAREVAHHLLMDAPHDRSHADGVWLETAIAQALDAFAERRAAKAYDRYVKDHRDLVKALGHYSGSNVQPAIEQIADAIRALADKPAAGKGEP